MIAFEFEEIVNVNYAHIRVIKYDTDKNLIHRETIFCGDDTKITEYNLTELTEISTRLWTTEMRETYATYLTNIADSV